MPKRLDSELVWGLVTKKLNKTRPPYAIMVKPQYTGKETKKIMAVTVNEDKVVTLLDGQKIEIRPLKISLLRPFLAKFQSIQDVAEDNDESMNLLMECVQIAMKQFKPELAEDMSVLEDLIDLPTVYKIVEEASGNSTLFGGQAR